MIILYNIGLLLYDLIIRIVALWNPKAKLWVDGRKDLFKRMQSSISKDDKIVWVHAASLGEFEQGRPIIERVRAEHPEYKILLTFFSPSGYEVRKGYQGADYIFYLPLDRPSNVAKFLDIAHPEVAIFVKYEFWINLLGGLRTRGIRAFLVSAIFRQDSIFFKSYGTMWRRALESFETLFVQDRNSAKLLGECGFDNVVVAGDTRFDRVWDIAQAAKRIELVEKFRGESKLFVVGSSWPEDEVVLIPMMEKYLDVKFVIAPHEIENDRVEALMSKLSGRKAIRYTTCAADTKVEEYDVLVLDTMGMLSSVYSYAKWAYIGGGFGVGIHNTLEAATFGLPIAFGTNYKRFKEACDLISLGAAVSISNTAEVEEWFKPLHDDAELLERVSRISAEFTARQRGATSLLMSSIFVK